MNVTTTKVTFGVAAMQGPAPRDRATVSCHSRSSNSQASRNPPASVGLILARSGWRRLSSASTSGMEVGVGEVDALEPGAGQVLFDEVGHLDGLLRRRVKPGI